MGKLVERSALALLAATALACGEKGRPGTPPEHLLLVTVQSLRADHCSFLGYPRATTRTRPEPEHEEHPPLDLDALADRGVAFARAFAPSPFPEPSLVALFSSTPPAARADAPPDAGAETLAELLARAGWRTAGFCAPGRELGPLGIERGFEQVEQLADPRALPAAADWAAERLAAGERCFLWIHLGGASPPFDGAPLADVHHEPGAAGPRVEIDRYDGGIARANAALRAFLERYAALPGAPLDRTLVVVAGTNGVALAGDASPASPLSDATLHVPLVLSHPPSLTGRRILGAVVELADVLPTLCEWLALPRPASARGRSLLPLVDTFADLPFEHRPAFARTADEASARDERWRWVQPVGTEGARVLLDGDLAPAQRVDASGERPAKAAALARELEAWLAGGRAGRP